MGGSSHLRLFSVRKCLTETEILGEQQPVQGVFVCDHAGRAISKSSLVRHAPLIARQEQHAGFARRILHFEPSLDALSSRSDVIRSLQILSLAQHEELRFLSSTNSQRPRLSATGFSIQAFLRSAGRVAQYRKPVGTNLTGTNKCAFPNFRFPHAAALPKSRRAPPRQSPRGGRQKSIFPQGQWFSKVKISLKHGFEGIYPHWHSGVAPRLVRWGGRAVQVKGVVSLDASTASADPSPNLLVFETLFETSTATMLSTSRMLKGYLAHESPPLP